VYMIIWGAIDPLKLDYVYILTDRVRAQDGSTLVMTIPYCDCNNRGWVYAAIIWQALLLLFITVQVVQTRQIRKELNESRTLATMIYSHFVFVSLRLASVFISSSKTLNPSSMALVQSLLMSLDALSVLGIYFVPKLLSARQEILARSGSGSASSLVNIHALDTMVSQQAMLDRISFRTGSRQSLVYESGQTSAESRISAVQAHQANSSENTTAEFTA
jgi:7 transmembrane sweet-taste receptor of 3 GCPR